MNESRLVEVLEAHRRFHRKVGCPGEDCYVCQAEDAFQMARGSLPSGSLRPDDDKKIPNMTLEERRYFYEAREAVQRLKARAPFATGTNYLLDLDTIEAALGPSEPAPEGLTPIQELAQAAQDYLNAQMHVGVTEEAMRRLHHRLGSLAGPHLVAYTARLSQGGQE